MHMNLKKTIRRMAYSAILAAIITVIVIAGGFFDIIDLACASLAALILQVVYTEMGGKSAVMIYAVSAALSFILMPLRSATLYFVTFFGYYPILRGVLLRKMKSKKVINFLLCLLFNAVMIVLYAAFRTVFGIENEPVYVYVLLIISANIFFACFEMLMGKIMILYNYKIKKLFKTQSK